MQNFTQQQIDQIRQIIQDEKTKDIYKMPKTQKHTHDGIDSPRIDKQNLTGNKINSGVVTFARETQYTLAVNFVPNYLWFYGIVTNGSANTIKGQCIGNALLGGSFYMAPSSSTSTKVSQTIQNIAQSSTYFLVDTTTESQSAIPPYTVAFPTFHALADQTHLIDVEYPAGTIYARATVISASGGGIVINVDNLASGWKIIGNYVIY